LPPRWRVIARVELAHFAMRRIDVDTDLSCSGERCPTSVAEDVNAGGTELRISY